jgi:hypothetical protein
MLIKFTRPSRCSLEQSCSAHVEHNNLVWFNCMRSVSAASVDVDLGSQRPTSVRCDRLRHFDGLCPETGCVSTTSLWSSHTALSH